MIETKFYLQTKSSLSSFNYSVKLIKIKCSKNFCSQNQSHSFEGDFLVCFGGFVLVYFFQTYYSGIHQISKLNHWPENGLSFFYYRTLIACASSVCFCLMLSAPAYCPGSFAEHPC